MTSLIKLSNETETLDKQAQKVYNHNKNIVTGTQAGMFKGDGERPMTMKPEKAKM